MHVYDSTTSFSTQYADENQNHREKRSEENSVNSYTSCLTVASGLYTGVAMLMTRNEGFQRACCTRSSAARENALFKKTVTKHNIASSISLHYIIFKTTQGDQKLSTFLLNMNFLFQNHVNARWLGCICSETARHACHPCEVGEKKTAICFCSWQQQLRLLLGFEISIIYPEPYSLLVNFKASCLAFPACGQGNCFALSCAVLESTAIWVALFIHTKTCYAG